MNPERIALYAGGFLGPFGGGVVAVLIPELRDAFDTTTGGVTASITAYLVPFAALQVVSGTLGERFGVVRTIRGAYVFYAAASLAAIAATSLAGFLAARALQGAANAFTSPLLLSALAEATPDAELGRAMGLFNGVQTAGMVSAPLIGGLAGAIDWRVAFIASAVAGLVLAVAPAPGAAGRAHAEPVRLRQALTRRTAWTSVAAFMAFLTITGLGFLVAIRAADTFGLGPTARGLLLASLGAAGVLAAAPAGRLVDRRDPVTVIAAGVAVAAVAVAGMGFVESAGVLAAVWFSAGVGSALIWAGLNTLAVGAAPANRAGAVSLVGAFKFAGGALSPLLLLPLYHADVHLAFLVAAAASVGIALAARAAASA